MEEQPEMTPERKARMVRILLVISPVAAAFCYWLASIQGAAPLHSALIAGVMFVGCLGAAVLVHLRGSKAGSDAGWIALILALFARR